jgi:hypothetical protein
MARFLLSLLLERGFGVKSRSEGRWQVLGASWGLGARHWVLEAGGTPKDVKNEGRSGDMYENKDSSDKMPNSISGISAQ